MKTEKAWESAFGAADPAFSKAVYKALSDIQESEREHEEEILMKRKMRMSLVFALIACLVLAAAALAATRLGVLDFIVGRFAEDVRVLPSATELIQENPNAAPAHTQFADFSVREAVFDGQQLYVVVAAAPADGQTLLMGPDSDPSFPVSDFGPRFDNKAGSIADYAKEIGATRTANTSIGSLEESEIFFNSLDSMLEEDGTLVYMMTGAYEGDADEARVALGCASWDSGDIGSISRASVSFALKASPATVKAVSAQSVEYPDCGVRVDSVILTATPMAVYTQLRYTVIDPEKYAATDGGLWFEFLDENGERITGGAPGSGSVSSLNDAGTEFVQRDSLSAMEVLPKSVTLRGYNCWEKNRYEAREIPLQ